MASAADRIPAVRLARAAALALLLAIALTALVPSAEALAAERGGSVCLPRAGR